MKDVYCAGLNVVCKFSWNTLYKDLFDVFHFQTVGIYFSLRTCVTS